MAAALPVWAALWFADSSAATFAHVEDPRFWALVLLVPLGEELLFRGGLQGWLIERPLWSRRFGGLSLANWLTSAAFVIAHLQNQPIGWALAVFVPSLVFGAQRDRHRSVLPAFALHAFYNTGFFLVSGLPA